MIKFIVTFAFAFAMGVNQSFSKKKNIETEYSASAEEMKKLVKIEVQIFQALKKFREQQEFKEFKSIASYLNEFPEVFNDPSSIEQEKFAKNAVKNPLNIYLCLRRFVNLVPRVKNELIRYNQQDLLQMFENFESKVPFPSYENMVESIKSIIRLKYTYNISADDFIRGNLGGFHTGTILNAQQSYEIANVASQNNFWSIAIDFYEASRKLAFADGRTSLDDISRIEAILQDTIDLHDELLSQDVRFQDISPTLFQFQLKNRKSPEFHARREIVTQPGLNFPDNRVATEAAYEALCRGEEIRKTEETSKLKCLTAQRGLPNKYWLIRPVQIEHLSQNPPIIQIYNFLSSTEVERVVDASKPELERSRYVNGAADSHRTSSSCFIADSEKESQFYYINQRIESLTGLKVTSATAAEDLQITQYPAGGSYNFHYDSTDSTEPEDHPASVEVREFGDRIATFMIYLSDVELGGKTAFPISGVSVWPVKGSAIFWYNLHEDGSLDKRSLHGGCPVLYGTKWVANKWISSNEQMFRRKCLPMKHEENTPTNSNQIENL